jgi:hypothetical protein
MRSLFQNPSKLSNVSHITETNAASQMLADNDVDRPKTVASGQVSHVSSNEEAAEMHWNLEVISAPPPKSVSIHSMCPWKLLVNDGNHFGGLEIENLYQQALSLT